MEKTINLTNFEISKKSITLNWEDGHKSDIKLRYLRSMCPCAGCVNEITGKRMIREDDIPEDITITDTDKMGNYGIIFLWSDNHYTGIYSFQLLRELCPCQKCKSP